ncbi:MULTISPECIES: bifunctional riboflavin kinase/FAD synthetase [Romboutsia]|uniref:bifunctional riboflavin kinase/FAD synthetase n=1 Tax=Romboutsia TaxID=1501226 RepID=UPI001899D42F|nr:MULTISPECIES: bifunctional riboflavin kinase/FAD synthetase [Romboutsia]MCH1960810.1 bifunctional riboflavin kinase/FAD synthetase [Romboutsia hominis]MCH1968757.1 bifunctional riboflavin kinase/FAD synthetase [Romboutsia hominis]MDB8804365.1 bifunctional riboflavin kinase/FAD synthetase [Romboutsia sp. 1001216sp1]MDB8807677.1 bifunctional riboflavin kinase/FAD synthetase [Romboutsia sp. 1001216sp1]MDB8810011.1 bifunctional riboflavin kinase/FAD synthetase [Romboutsia sp. 1001216sp1]
MDIIKSIDKIQNINKSVVTIGNFDGLHKGHQVLVKKAVEYGFKNNIKSVVFTFDNHPANYFIKNSIKNIISNKEKEQRIKDMGIDLIISIPFDEYMTKISPREFVKDILIDKLGVKKIIVGYDFTFAKNKEGNVNLLKELCSEYNFELEIVNPIKIDNIRVSSTYIRNLIKDGQVSKVKKYLGHNYEIKGEVIHAKKLGRTIGFPTANIQGDKNMIIPKNGIYATKVYIDGNTYYGATNIGFNPTVNGDKLSIETNILDFNEDIYGKIIKVEFLERIRDERKFSSLEELKQQLKKDTNYVRENYVCNISECMVK